MKSLDQILSDYVDNLTGFREKLIQHINVADWTKEDRDEKMKIIRDFSEQSSFVSVDLIRYLVDTELNGKPLIYWVMFREAISTELNFLIKMREDLDITVDEALPVIPVDYEWITDLIRARIEEIDSISKMIEPELESPGTTEEV